MPSLFIPVKPIPEYLPHMNEVGLVWPGQLELWQLKWFTVDLNECLSYENDVGELGTEAAIWAVQTAMCVYVAPIMGDFAEMVQTAVHIKISFTDVLNFH